MTFDPQPVRLEGRHATLEPLALRHADELFEVGKHAGIWEYMPLAPLTSLADATALIREALAEGATGTQIPFAIIDVKSGKVAGSTRYLEIRRDLVDMSIPFPKHIVDWNGSFPVPKSDSRKLTEIFGRWWLPRSWRFSPTAQSLPLARTRPPDRSSSRVRSTATTI